MSLMIGVYAICKNEAKNIIPWAESCIDADCIAITDTGSTDQTLEMIDDAICENSHIELFKSYVVPWRFDDAMNAALSHLNPACDIAIRLDLDERLQPGWRAVLERVWTQDTTILRYPYIWNWQDDGTPGFHFDGDRIHSRFGWRWSGVTHEGLVCRTKRVETYTRDVQIFQYPDRSKPRPDDLPMLEEAVRETPTDLRLQVYLAREYLWRNMPEKCIETSLNYLSKAVGYAPERMAVYTYLAKSDPTRAEYYLRRAIAEAPNFREPWVDLMTIYYNRQAWEECFAAAQGALSILIRPPVYVCQPQAWSSYPHDICSIAAFKLGLINVAEEQAKLAIAKNPQDARLQTNLELIRAA